MKRSLCALLFCVLSGCASTRERPNVIFILADDLGYGDLGCYGQKVIQTPNLDRLAAEGTRFTDFYAGSTVCAPSRCCLMTGMHTGHARIRGNKTVPLEPQDVTVAEVFKQAGYTTGIVGKWGLGEPGTTGIPNRQGFDEWFGYLNQGLAHNYYPPKLWRNETEITLDGNLDGRRKQYSHDLFTQEALSFVERHKDRPFFLYLAYTIPHANNELGRDTGDGMEVPDYGPYADRDWPGPEKGKAAMIARMDRDIGRLMELLKKLGLDGKTLVLFTSDNGPHHEGGVSRDFFDSNGPLRGGKRDLYEGGIRVPMIACRPGTVPAGRVCEQAWTMWDFLPTMCKLTGQAPPPGLDGMSMLPLIEGTPQPVHPYMYWEFHERGFLQAVRTNHFKAVRKGLDRPLELYDLRYDIGEQNDVSADYPDVVERIEAYLRTARTESSHWPVRPAR
ncbi:MAG TPA: arylsulfatase [Phycisphaerae bacterium]|nr:arylsulfatase [Phycisphaerae bacterium]